MKSLICFKLQTPVTFTEENIAEIERLAFTPCKDNDLSSTGFSNTVDGTLVSEISGNTVVVVTQQVKKPNPSEVKAKVNKRIVKFEEQFGKKVNSADKDSMKGEVIRELLPTTYPNEPVHSTIVFTKEYVLVEAGSYAKAEDLLVILRTVLGSLPAIPLQTVNIPEEILGDIVVDNKTEFTMGNKVVISTDDGENKGKSSFAKDNVFDNEPKRLIKTGSFIDVINLGYESMTMNVKPDLSIGAIKFDKEFLSEVDKDDTAGSFILKMGEIELMVVELVETMGGLSE